MSEIETIVNQFINSNNTGEINPTTVSHIIIWTLLIVILISFGFSPFSFLSRFLRVPPLDELNENRSGLIDIVLFILITISKEVKI